MKNMSKKKKKYVQTIHKMYIKITDSFDYKLLSGYK